MKVISKLTGLQSVENLVGAAIKECTMKLFVIPQSWVSSTNKNIVNFLKFIPSQPQLHRPPLLPLLPIYSSSLSLLKRADPSRDLNRTWQNKLQSDEAQLPQIKAGWCDPVGRKGSPKQAKSQRQFPLSLLGVPRKQQATQLSHMCRGPRPDPLQVPWLLVQSLWAHMRPG